MRHRICVGAAGGVCLFLLLLHVMPAFAFVYESPFMYVGQDEALPSLRFQEFVSGEMKEFDSNLKHPLIMIFFGVDIDTKRERSIEVLADIQESLEFYRQRNVDLATVFVQPEELLHIDEVIAPANIDFPVYVDRQNLAFERLGVYVMPSILIVNGDGIIHKGLGYSHNLDEILPAEIMVMLHEKSREAVNADLHPEIVERSTAQRQARLDYNYALNLVERHRIDLALEKLEMALDKDPDFVPALVEEGCLLVKKEKFQEAGVFLERSLTLAPCFPRALRCKVELEKGESQGGKAAKDSGATDPASWGFFADDDEEEDTTLSE